ncbi:MAG TPA: FAD:protein FMN transferase [Abditibacteriaceae bacterium]|jgi:thiamine biosynthesis lipoprotein
MSAHEQMPQSQQNAGQDDFEAENVEPEVWRFTHHAMACTWQLFLAGEERNYAENVSYVAWDELERLERELSRFIAASDVTQVNCAAPGEAVTVGLATMECLLLAREVFELTNGAFDITVGAVLDVRRNEDGTIGESGIDEPDTARGMEGLHIDANNFQVSWKVAGASLDLGAIGKGYTVDHIARVLEEWSVGRAIIHGGQSTVMTIGTPQVADEAGASQEQEGWPLLLRDPLDETRPLGTIYLRDRALSGSGVRLHGAHIIDPRSGAPVSDKLGAWALSHSAARSDALSTAFMVMTPQEVEEYCRLHPDDGALLLLPGDNEPQLLQFGNCAGLQPPTC